MQNFDYMTPTRLIFGKEAIEKLPAVMNAFGKRVLLTYGGGSIKKLGLYDKVISMLTDKPTGLFVHHGGKVTYFCRRKQIIPSFSLDYSSHTLTEGSWLASLSSSKNPSLDSCLSSDMIL